MENEKIVTMLTDHENRIKVSEHRVKDLEAKTDKIEELTMSVHSLAVSVKQMADDQLEYRSTQADMVKRLTEVEQAPIKRKAKMHDDIVSDLIKLLLSAFVGFILAYIGLSI